MWLIVPRVPVIVTALGVVVVVAVVVATSVSVEDEPGATVVWLNVPVTPVGSPETLSVMFPGEPENTAVSTVTVVMPPLSMVVVVGDEDIEKSSTLGSRLEMQFPSTFDHSACTT